MGLDFIRYFCVFIIYRFFFLILDFSFFVQSIWSLLRREVEREGFKQEGGQKERDGWYKGREKERLIILEIVSYNV